MKNNLTTRILTLLIITILVGLIFSYDVKAVQLNNIGGIEGKAFKEADNEITELLEVEDEEKILMYDAKTGKTAEVDMEAIRNKIDMLSNENDVEINQTEPYVGKEVNESLITPFGNSSTGEYHRITNTTEFPYRATCFITCSGGTATGFLVGPNLLLTSAHCVINPNSNEVYTNWLAYPAYRAGAYNGYSDGWRQIIYSSNWISNHKAEDDWCLCILGSNLGEKVGWLGLRFYHQNEGLNNRAMKAIGYPHLFANGLEPYYTEGKISNVSTQKFDVSAAINHGMSGGPMIEVTDNYVLGITSKMHTARQGGIATRITQNILDLVKDRQS